MAAHRLNPVFERVLGPEDQVRGSDHDLFSLLSRNAAAPRKPRLFVACGTADFLYGQFQAFVPALRENGWDVTASEKPGASHEWAYWDELIAQFIPWCMK